MNSVDVPQIVENNIKKYKSHWNAGVSQEQLEFLTEALTFTETGWGVIILTHHPIIEIEGYSKSQTSSITREHGGEQLYGIIKAFKDKGVYYHYVTGNFASTVDVDFTATPVTR